VDGLAEEAGVTSGAFHGHFLSKADVFQAAAVAGLVELPQVIETLRAKGGDNWLGKFTDFYMSFKRTGELRESCALQSLTAEVARAGEETKIAYEAEMLRLIEAIAAGLSHGIWLSAAKHHRRFSHCFQVESLWHERSTAPRWELRSQIRLQQLS